MSLQFPQLEKLLSAFHDFFFQAESLGASPVERCSSCKVSLKNCRLCSSEKALLSAQEEEYVALKDHTEFDSVSSHLHVRYPFSRVPLILIGNSLAAKKRQIAQEKKQIRDTVHK